MWNLGCCPYYQQWTGKGAVSCFAGIFNKLPEVDKKIKANDKFKRIMSISTSAEIIVHIYFLQDVKPAFDRFLEVLQTEGPLIHVLHPPMLLLLKQLMQRFLKAECIGKTVTELLC